MAGPLAGIKVVEMGVWVAGPSCAGMLADWGASVIKIEPPTGDPFRGLFASFGSDTPNPPFELDNRGKRSSSLDLENEHGLSLALELIAEADVFVTNMRPRVLEKYGLDYGRCAARDPRIVYAEVSGYGPDHAESNRASYDVGAFWARSGVGSSLTPPGQDPPQQRGGMGDHMTGANAAGAVSAALFNRERTGEGQRVAVSLMRIGAYMMGWDLNTLLRFGPPAAEAMKPYDRHNAPNPIINSFRDKNGRWFWLLLLQADRHWPDLLRAIAPSSLGADPRFASIPDRTANAEALVRELDAIFETKTLAEWSPIFDREQVWFAPVQTLPELAEDAVAEAAGVFIDMDSPQGPARQVATPATFFGTPIKPQSWAPELGQNTEEILQELGYDWDRIIESKEAGAIP